MTTPLEKGLGATVLILVAIIISMVMVLGPKYAQVQETSKTVFNDRAYLIEDLNNANAERAAAETARQRCEQTIMLATASPLDPQ